ncbi:unnamed protein product [Lecanosticta acicola]|uniref:Unnamed protein product n=1 Tax=Lecanosticta acicola TaxID=111012 RepID=A0AAI9EA51_9PEZI|nr:unnamed protein product [Lecanosticta acicola]
MAEGDGTEKKSRFSSAPLTIIVGPPDAQQTFYVHAAWIQQKSAFFHAAFDRKWQEAQSRQLELPEDIPEVVAAYLEWIYFAALPSHSNIGLTQAELPRHYRLLAQLYVFAEKIQDDACCNRVLASFAQRCEEPVLAGTPVLFTYETLRIIYAGTPPASPIRRFFVDVASESGHATFSRDADAYPREFLVELTYSLLVRCPQPKVGNYFLEREKWYKKRGDGDQAK